MDRIFSEIKKESKKTIDIFDGTNGTVYIEVKSEKDGVRQGVNFTMDKYQFAAFIKALEEHEKIT